MWHIVLIKNSLPRYSTPCPSTLYLTSFLFKPPPPNFFFEWYGANRELPSFPTRRSSDIYFLNFPPLNLTCKSILNFTVSPLQDFLSRFQVIFKTRPPKPYMQEYSQLHSLPSPRLLVTIPSHFLNFLPLNLTCKSILSFTVIPPQDFLSRFQVI